MSNASEKHLRIVETGKTPRRSMSTTFAEIGDQLTFDADILDALAEVGCKPIHYDLLVLSAAVEFADRRWKRPQGWTRDFYLTLPVIELDTWQLPSVEKGLERALKHLTGDSWHFAFLQAKNLKPCEWRQLRLHFPDPKAFAIAYSEGLDSRAVAALSGNPDEGLRIRVTDHRQKPRSGETFFTQIPFAVAGRHNESSFRSRGFKFASITAIASHIRGLKRIVVPESGQGALGPAMLPLHKIYADYRNYPTFFRQMEHFISAVLGHQLAFEQPRLWSTKGQTLREYLKLTDKKPIDLIDTRSCWQTRSVVNIGGKRLQCGLCAACLLRRLSLHSAQIDEPADTYVVEDLTRDLDHALSSISEDQQRRNMVAYGSVGSRHYQHLAEMSSLTDDELMLYCLDIAQATKTSMRETVVHLRALLESHAEEWESFLSSQGKRSFLRQWMDGGIDVRLE